MVRSAMTGAGRMLLLVCLVTVLFGCPERKPVLTIETPEAKISPTLLGVVSVFMKINNTGNGDDHLLGASTNMPGTVVELHDIADGKMVKVDRIAVPAGGQLMLRPARHHIMIYRMPKDLKEGTRFELVLNFERSGSMQVQCETSEFGNRKVLQK